MAVSVTRVVLNAQYASNCYVVRASVEAVQAAVVDPGGDPAPLLGELGRAGIRVAGVLVTHADVDHVAGVAALAQATGAEVWAPADEAGDVRLGKTRGGYPITAHDPENLVVDGDTITVAGLEFGVTGIPGHSRDHVAFATEGSIFSGDLLFAGAVGRTDFEGGDWPTLLGSVERLVARYGRDAVVYPGHGEPTTLGRELDTNPFLGELRAG
jgi:glyoxylase-like metal-dependent hydrolase (beta-lactamase superfamily II)